MRRRSKRAPNLSESTGKIGQELPSNQPAPLVPSYMDEPVSRPPEQSRAPQPRAPAAESPRRATPPERQPRAERAPRPQPPASWNEPPSSGRLEVETQPEIPSVPPPEAQPADRSPQAPKGYVVLAIGLPGSGKTTWFRRRGVTPLSSDLLRNILFDHVDEQRYQGLVLAPLRPRR